MTMFNFSKTAFAALIVLASVASVSAAPQDQSGASVRPQRQVVTPSVSPDEQPLDIAKGNIW